MVVIAGLGQGPRNRAGGTSNPKRACAGDTSRPQRKPRRVGPTKEGLRPFKPLHGFAGRGLLASAAVGRARLRRLVNRREDYVAQRWVTKPCLQIDGAPVWTDLRVWAYRGEVFHLSGRASRRADRLDLAPPGGWLPPYVAV